MLFLVLCTWFWCRAICDFCVQLKAQNEEEEKEEEEEETEKEKEREKED